MIFAMMIPSAMVHADTSTVSPDFPYTLDNGGNLGAQAGLDVAKDSLPQGIEKQDSAKVLILQWVTYFLQFYTLVAVGIVIYLGIRLIVSFGNEDQRKETIKALINLAIGTALIYLSYAIVNTIVNVINPGDLFKQVQDLKTTNP